MSTKRNHFRRPLAAVALASGFGALLMLAGLGPAAGQQPSPPEGAQQIDPETTVVARVGDTEIYLVQLLEMMDDLPPQYRQMPFQQIYPALLNRAVDTTLLARAARDSDVAEEQGVQRRLRAAEDRVLSQAWLNRSISEDITDEAIEARYEDFREQNAGNEEMRARHILLETEAEARETIAELKEGADFAALAEERSTGPSAVEGGDLGWFGTGQMVPAFEQATLALEPGDFSQEPVQTQFGWHVILLEDKRTSEAPPLDEVRDQLTAELTRELIQQRLAGLREDATISTFNLDGSVPSATPAPAPAPVPAPE